ncbi:hypothetical protein I8751_16070 [Nostocaceae cyanobacterium CENA357]|uniref:Uncharacterized protein n=1 Tax=Atlanticothrix silvestris CENA357 TaxID=1725252 RepID=A0A8J7HF34_9CYAN|nr:hypothetical protein [Atlanticothrix silvestris]MBH8553859.1 hypothetical protein [Atlanticothrix silvestris CENA357]
MNHQLQLEPPPQAFFSPLLELRDHYAGLVEKYEQLYTQARSHLNHVEALLSNWSSDSDIKGRLSTAEINHQLSLPDSISHSGIDSVNSIQSEVGNSDNLQIDHSSTVVEDTNKPQISTTSPAIDTSLESKENSIKGIDIPMLPQHHPLSRMEAIKKLLEEHSGTVCHIDFIVRSLYGDLEQPVFKVVKGRVQSSLTQGRERNAWSAIPDEPGCYTLDLSLVKSNRTHNGHSQAAKHKKNRPIAPLQTNVVPMLKEFEGQFLIDALSSFFEQNPRKIFTVAEIIAGLYGELDAEEVREIKSKVLNELSRGHRTGRFSRVPEQIGLYTWDSNLKLEARSV